MPIHMNPGAHTPPPSPRRLVPLARLPRALSGLLAACAAILVFGTGSAWALVSPSLAATSSPDTTVGLQIFDHTNLMGAASPTGTISYALYAPGDTSCSTPIFTASVPATGSDNSPTYWTTSAGTYRWTAAYSGDANNNPSATPCGSPSESVIVGQHRVGAVLTAKQMGGAVRASLAVTDGYGPTGRATFTVTGPNDTWCDGPVVYTSTVNLHGDGTYDSGSFRPSVPGTYTFRLRYDGDSNNLGVGPTNCLDDNASATVRQALFVNPSTGQLDTSQPISWTPVNGAQAYGLSVGSTRGAGDLASIGLPGTTTSFDVAMLPTARTLYARLWTQVNGVWVGYQDVTFTTMGQGAAFTSPTEGDVAQTTRLSWSQAASADMYGLWVGTAKGTADVASLHLSTAASSYDVPAMPVGRTLYARVWTRVNGVWARYQDISFTTPAS
jgi:hypothetical protein